MSQFSSISPDFRESLRFMADDWSKRPQPQTTVKIAIAMDGETTKDVEYGGGWLASRFTGEGENFVVMHEGQWKKIKDLPVGTQVQVMIHDNGPGDQEFEQGIIVEVPKVSKETARNIE